MLRRLSRFFTQGLSMSSIALKYLDLNSSSDPNDDDDGVETESDSVDESLEEKYEMGMEEKWGLEGLGGGSGEKVDIESNVEVLSGVGVVEGKESEGGEGGLENVDCVDGGTEPRDDRNVGNLVCDVSVGRGAMGGAEGRVGAPGGEAVGEARLEKVDINARNVGTLVCDIGVSPEKGRGTMGVERTESDGEQERVGALLVGEGSLDKVDINRNVEQAAVVEPPKGGGFSNSDLVWGKVKTHPWWPGQIMDPSYASELAMKLYKKGTYLVAYFGDGSFAWNEPVTLKPFTDHFSQLEKQTNVVAFCAAVDCALEEISRRVQSGLSCSCIREEIYDVAKSQIVVNAGVQENLCITDGVDASFEPSQLLEYVKSLALYQGNVGGRVEFVIARAQIGAFYSSKGYFQLPQFDMSKLSDHAENAMPVYHIEEKAHSGRGRGRPRSQNKSITKALDRLEDSLESRKIKKSPTELMEPKLLLIGEGEKGESEAVGPYSGTKRNNIESSFGDTTSKRGRLRPLSSTERDGRTESPISKDPQVGQRIRNIARQLCGSPPVFKPSGDSVQKSDFKVDGKLHEVDVSMQIEDRTLGRITVAKEYSSPDVMLSQLCLAARDPMKGYSFVGIIDFFTDFRNSNVLGPSFTVKHKNSEKVSGGEKIVKKRKQSNSKVHSTGSFEYEAVSDSYWTDRIILSTPDEQVSQKKPKRNTDSLKSSTTFEPETSHASNLVSDSKKNGSTLESVNELQHNPTVAEKSVDNKNSEEISPTSLILNFTDAKSIPLESDLNRIFSQFESLEGSETKLLRKTKQAMLVFERRSDAEEAYTHACKFSVFGPALVGYFLTPLKASPRTRRQARKGAASLKGGGSN